MQIGLIGGIGPAATDFYFLIEKFESEKKEFGYDNCTADAPTLIKNLMEDNKDRQVAIYNDLILLLLFYSWSLLHSSNLCYQYFCLVCKKKLKTRVIVNWHKYQ